jgi:hypothetical protein
MSRNMSSVLVLAAGLALAGKTLVAGQAAGADAPKARADAAQGSKEEAPQGGPAQGQKDGAQASAQTSEQAAADEPQADGDAKLKSVPGGKALGMSILGNQEAPTSLVIVPWKGSELGDARGISTMLDDSRQPVDKDVFMRMLGYYEISVGRNTAAGKDVAQPATVQRRK